MHIDIHEKSIHITLGKGDSEHAVLRAIARAWLERDRDGRVPITDEEVNTLMDVGKEYPIYINVEKYVTEVELGYLVIQDPKYIQLFERIKEILGIPK